MKYHHELEKLEKFLAYSEQDSVLEKRALMFIYHCSRVDNNLKAKVLQHFMLLGLLYHFILFLFLIFVLPKIFKKY